MEVKKELSFTTISVQISQIGADYAVLLKGGDKPHIGCAVMAVPRPSLTGDGSGGSTASVLNLIGHKDEEPCRFLAEQIARKKGAVAVCTGGIHMDDITPGQIEEIMEVVREIGNEICVGDN
ncbi:MAG: hypothetical protein NC400_08870 [Clostridium sp.]|nr:hypothetical protein [Clostridium sp.]